MKNSRLAVPVLLIALGMAPLALAGETVALDVPFGFTAGKTHFPPGSYVLDMDRLSPGTVHLQGPKSAILLSSAAAGSREGSPILTFSAYGERRFLSAIQTANRTWNLLRSAEETALAANATEPVMAQLRARQK